jgi:hypothetical protein
VAAERQFRLLGVIVGAFGDAGLRVALDFEKAGESIQILLVEADASGGARLPRLLVVAVPRGLARPSIRLPRRLAR